MPRFTIHHLPDDIYEQLRQRARSTGRTLDAEAIACLERGLRDARISVARLRTSAQRIRSRNPDLWITDGALRQARDEGRP